MLRNQKTKTPTPAETEFGRRPWAVTILRAVNPDGSLLWNQWNLESFKDNYWSGGAAAFSAVFMQDPSGLVGEFFDPNCFRTFAFADFVSKDGLPADELLRRGIIDAIYPADEVLLSLQGHDFALSKKSSADYYARVNMHSSRAGDIYVVDVKAGRLSVLDMLEDIAAGARRWKAVALAIDEDILQEAIRQAAAIASRVNLVEGINQLPWRPEPTGGRDKLLRARPYATKIELAGRGHPQVFFLHGAPWLTAYQMQLAAFPGDPHDDMVDASAAVYALTSAWRPEDIKAAADLMEKLRVPNVLDRRRW